MVNNRRTAAGWKAVVVMCVLVVVKCMLCAGGNTGTLEQLEQLEHWKNRNNKKVVVNSVGKMYGGCGLYREDV